MFTAEDARDVCKRDWDDLIRRTVEWAGRSGMAVIKIYNEDNSDSRPMAERISEAVTALQERGFQTEVRDPDSLRFAEVHFTWKEVDSAEG